MGLRSLSALRLGSAGRRRPCAPGTPRQPCADRRGQRRAQGEVLDHLVAEADHQRSHDVVPLAVELPEPLQTRAQRRQIESADGREHVEGRLAVDGGDGLHGGGPRRRGGDGCEDLRSDDLGGGVSELLDHQRLVLDRPAADRAQPHQGRSAKICALRFEPPSPDRHRGPRGHSRPTEYAGGEDGVDLGLRVSGPARCRGEQAADRRLDRGWCSVWVRSCGVRFNGERQVGAMAQSRRALSPTLPRKPSGSRPRAR